MATTCKYCGRPTDYRPRPRESFHNEGCPVFEKGPLWEEWKKGFSRGWRWDFDGPIHHWNWKYYSKSFILGYVAGKQEIDSLVDEVAQARYW